MRHSKISYRHGRMTLAVLAVSCLCSLSALAQVQVVEAGDNQAPSRSRAATGGNNSNELLISLYNQLETLQQEVQTLRGMVEEQNYKQQQLEMETRQRYMDIDRRLTELATMPVDPEAQGEGAEGADGMGAQGGAGARNNRVGDVRTSVGFNPAVQSSAAAAGNEPGAAAENATATLPDAATLNEEELYRTALNLLLEDGNSADSVAFFQSYVERFPEGRLMPNTLYWQGEGYILLTRYPQAREVFERVLRDFPSDPKAPGAMLKLGVVYNLMGERGMAEQTWRELPLRYPDSVSENTLAEEYLKRQPQ